MWLASSVPRNSAAAVRFSGGDAKRGGVKGSRSDGVGRQRTCMLDVASGRASNPGLRTPHSPERRMSDTAPARQSVEHVHRMIRESILDGSLTPGETMSQVALADELGVSRTPLREALRMLQG